MHVGVTVLSLEFLTSHRHRLTAEHQEDSLLAIKQTATGGFKVADNFGQAQPIDLGVHCTAALAHLTREV